DPGPDDGFDRAIERGAIDDGSLAFVAPDNEMHAHQRTFREKRIKGAHAPFKDGGEIIADPRPDLAVVAIARDVGEDRHEAVEAVAPRQYPYARAFVELEDRKREVIERLFVDLKQFVARVVLEHVDQRLAGMAARIKSGAADSVIDLTPQIGNGAHRTRVGGGREQPAEHAFAHYPALAVEVLDPDVIQSDAPVHARAHRGLGHDEQLRLFEELADFGSDGHELIAAPE